MLVHFPPSRPLSLSLFLSLPGRESESDSLLILQHPEKEFLLRASYLEIYNETLKDLLAPESGPLKIRQDEKVCSRPFTPRSNQMNSSLRLTIPVLLSETLLRLSAEGRSSHGGSPSGRSSTTGSREPSYGQHRFQRTQFKESLRFSNRSSFSKLLPSLWPFPDFFTASLLYYRFRYLDDRIKE